MVSKQILKENNFKDDSISQKKKEKKNSSRLFSAFFFPTYKFCTDSLLLKAL